jgi:hypothetical protein
MNRHARRRARALGRRAGYLHRLLADVHGRGLKPGHVYHVTIEHDHDCAHFAGRGCDCIPAICQTGPDGVAIIDERGRATMVARQ